ncbi:MAG: riboflavin synthase [Rhodospirillaceae bacterium]|nr:riboflavin synthase [Rhodospirillaceae bacterium]
MFTGIITDLGRVTEVASPIAGASDRRFHVSTRLPMDEIAIGASIACNGCCLTVVKKGAEWFAADVSAETLSKTTLGSWGVGTRVNLERSLRAGDELGGHIVSGHVDGVVEVASVRDDGASKRFTIRPPQALSKFVASKGSVALDGVSLTVNEVVATTFGVNVIPHTQAETTFGTLKAGDCLNMEIDVLARYVARLLEGGSAAHTRG